MPDYPVPLVVTNEHDLTQAKQLAERWHLKLQQVTSGLVLWLDQHGLQLRQLDEPKTGGVQVDFAGEQLTYRRLHGGGSKQPVAKAVGIKPGFRPSVLDATAGLGKDSFILASLGCTVHMIERHNVVAALLDDGLQRAARHPELASWLNQKMHLLNGDAITLMTHWQGPRPDVVYLDPMFPHRKKSALVKKDMRLFQQLLGPDDDADNLLTPALKLATKRVVVKRPSQAPFLADKPPSFSQTGKANRFDIYTVVHQQD